MQTMVTIICRNCGTEKEKRLAEVNAARRAERELFCSRSCSTKYNNKQKKEYITVLCDNCGKSVTKEAKYVRYMQKKMRKFFCDQKCSREYSRKEYMDIACKECGKIIHHEAKWVRYAQKQGRNFFCDEKCAGIYNGRQRRGKPGKPLTEKQKKHLSEIRKNKPFSEAHIQAIRDAANNLESRRRRSEAHMGLRQSPEHTEAIRKAMNDPEVLQKISEGVKRAYEDPEMRQRQYEATMANLEKPEVREKISEGVQRAMENGLREKLREIMSSPEIRQKISEANTGRTWTLEQHEKMPAIISQNAKERWANISPEERRAHMQKAIQASLAITISSYEKEIRRIIENMGFECKSQYAVGPYFVDLYVPEYSVALDFHGCFWHFCPICFYDDQTPKAIKKRNKDRSREAYITKCAENNGFTYFQIWQHELSDLEEILNTIFSEAF